ncbi:MAG: hypothetical protein HC915_12245 [Anaerolineae bacterium]|nr:hypothetical protein [Anaerolineae bacterium]
MTVLFRETSREAAWVRVDLGNGAQGWMLRDHLRLSRDDWQRFVPSLNDNQLHSAQFSELDTLPGPFVSYTGWCRNNFIGFRTEPFEHARVLTRLDDAEPVEVLGQARINGAASQFVYVRHLNSDLQGWVLGDCVGYTEYGNRLPESYLGWINVNLPILATYEGVYQPGAGEPARSSAPRWAATPTCAPSACRRTAGRAPPSASARPICPPGRCSRSPGGMPAPPTLAAGSR